MVQSNHQLSFIIVQHGQNEFLVIPIHFKQWDNALIALAVFFVAVMLLANRITGTIIAIAFGGAVGFAAYQYALNASGRWDVGAAAAIIAAFFGFCFQHVHVEAFEKF